MKEKDHSKRKHSNFPASAASRWMNCPGSIELIKKAPPQVFSPAADEGTKAHECLEFLVKRYSNLKSAAALAHKNYTKILKDEDKAFEMVQHCLKSAEEIFKLKPSPKAKLLIEKRVFLKDLHKDAFGTLDYCWVDVWGSLVVIDFKYGMWQVSPVGESGKENAQLFYYAAGVAKEYDYEFSNIKLAIIQPRAYSEDGEITACHTTTIKRLRAFEKDMKAAIIEAGKPNAKLNADPEGEWCKFCPAATICPAISTDAMESAEIVFDIETGIQSSPDPKSLSAANLPVMLDACDFLETWISEVRKLAFSLAEKGVKISGRKLVDKRGLRHWTPEAEKKAEKEFGEDAFETKLLSPAQLEKKLGKDAKPFTEKYTTIVSSGVTLVHESDKRMEVSHCAFDIDKLK